MSDSSREFVAAPEGASFEYEAVKSLHPRIEGFSTYRLFFGPLSAAPVEHGPDETPDPVSLTVFSFSEEQETGTMYLLGELQAFSDDFAVLVTVMTSLSIEKSPGTVDEVTGRALSAWASHVAYDAAAASARGAMAAAALPSTGIELPWNPSKVPLTTRFIET